MREKEIDRRTGGIWYEFGIHSDGCVDVAQENGDVFEHVPKDVAVRVSAARDKFLNELYELLKDVR